MNEVLLRLESKIDHSKANINRTGTVVSFLREAISIIDESQNVDMLSNLRTELVDLIRLLNSSSSTEIINKLRLLKDGIQQFSLNKLEYLNKRIANEKINDFYILDNDGFNMVIAGSFDLSYYHNVEIKFCEVEFICCPQRFEVDQIRHATADEILELSKTVRVVGNDSIAFCLVDSSFGDKYYILAHAIEYKFETVFYYMRANLKDNERIASWVSKEVSVPKGDT